MKAATRNVGLCVLICTGLGMCGGHSSLAAPLDLEASSLAVAEWGRNASLSGDTAPTDAALLIQRNRTTLQLLDPRSPGQKSQGKSVETPAGWTLQLDGELRAGRIIGDTLYLVTTSRSRRSAETARECVRPQGMADRTGLADRAVISAINLRTRRITDASCLQTHVSGVHVSRQSVYVAGTAWSSPGDAKITVFHKFALNDGAVTYRATGGVVGSLRPGERAYFMDEHDGDLRVITTIKGTARLTVLRETADRQLMLVSSQPDSGRRLPADEARERDDVVVRFVGEGTRAVTFRSTDPLYVIRVAAPVQPATARTPGFAAEGPTTHPKAFDIDGSRRRVAAENKLDVPLGEGVSLPLFDVGDMTPPRLIGAKVHRFVSIP